MILLQGRNCSTDDTWQHGAHIHPFPEVPAKAAVTTTGCGCSIGCFKEPDVSSDGKVEACKDVIDHQEFAPGQYVFKGWQ